MSLEKHHYLSCQCVLIILKSWPVSFAKTEKLELIMMCDTEKGRGKLGGIAGYHKLYLVVSIF